MVECESSGKQEFSIVKLLCPFVFLEEFMNAYFSDVLAIPEENFLQIPGYVNPPRYGDTKTKLTDEQVRSNELALEKYGETLFPERNTDKIGRGRNDFVMLVLLLSMAKKFQGEEHLERFLEARMKALRGVSRDLNLMKSNIDEFIDRKCLTKVKDHFAKFPEMISTITYRILVLRDKEPVYKYIKDLLKGTFMQPFMIIYSFLNGGIITEAHLLPGVRAEIDLFNEAFMELQNKFGAHDWPYAKLVSPEITITNVKRYKNLYLAALIHNLGYNDSLKHIGHYFDYAGIDIQRMEELLNIDISDKYLRYKVFTAAEEECMAFYGINVDDFKAALERGDEVFKKADANVCNALDELIEELAKEGSARVKAYFAKVDR